VCADYMSGLREVRARFPARTLVLLWLGSSVGNLEDPEARAFFRGVLRITCQRTRVLLATDLWKAKRTPAARLRRPPGGDLRLHQERAAPRPAHAWLRLYPRTTQTFPGNTRLS